MASSDQDEKNTAKVEAEHREHQEQHRNNQPRILTIDEEAVDNAVHIHLSWRSWVRHAVWRIHLKATKKRMLANVLCLARCCYMYFCVSSPFYHRRDQSCY